MKNKFLPLFVSLCFVTGLKAQITINQTNFPFVSKASYQPVATASIPTLNLQAGGTFNLLAMQQNGGRREVLFEKVNNHPLFTTANEKSDEMVYFGPLPVKQEIYYDKNASGYFAQGIAYKQQVINLEDLSGSPDDSITFIDQTFAFGLPYAELSFPFTHNTTWSGAFKAETHFNLQLGVLGFNNTPCRFDNYFTSSSKVISHGNCLIPGKGVQSTPFPVLVVKTETMRIDSFFIDGQPANPFLVASMGLVQGDTIRTYKYRFFRAGAGMQQLAVIEFDDSTYSNPQYAEYSAEFDIASAGEINSSNGILVYPNPAGGNTVHITGENLASPQVKLFDIAGKELAAQLAGSEGSYSLTFDEPVSSGVYLLSITQNNKTTHLRLLIK